MLQITYQSLLLKSESLASHLLNLKIPAKSVVLIILPHSPELYYSFCSVLAINSIPSFMPFPTTKQPSERYWESHSKLFSKIKPSLIICLDDYAKELAIKIPSYSNNILSINDNLFESKVFLEEQFNIDINDTAFLQHSSGTTALKKGVMISHVALFNQINAYSKATLLTKKDVIISWLPLYHDMGLITCFLLPLLKEIPVVSIDTFKWTLRPHLLFKYIDQYKATLCWLPNFAFHHLIKNYPSKPSWKLDSIRAVINCSEPCKEQTFELFSKTTQININKLHVSYALAENVFAVSQTNTSKIATKISVCKKSFINNKITLAQSELTLISCGKIIEGTYVKVTDDNSNTLADSLIGEIQIKGNCLFKGYNNDVNISNRVFDGDWYKTGDMGFIYNNELFITGRVDDLFMCFGKNYYAHDLEFEINKIKGVLAGRCVILTDYNIASGTHDIIALVESAIAKEQINDLKIKIKQIIHESSNLTLSKVIILSKGNLLKSSSGKISRKQNKQKFIKRI